MTAEEMLGLCDHGTWGQFPPKPAPRETEALGRSLQAAVLNPRPSPALGWQSCGRRRKTAALDGGLGLLTQAPAAPPAPGILQPLRLRPRCCR